jgi:hypothetical protein
MSCGVRAKVGGVQGGPLTAGAQDVDDGVGTPPIGGLKWSPMSSQGLVACARSIVTFKSNGAAGFRGRTTVYALSSCKHLRQDEFDIFASLIY